MNKRKIMKLILPVVIVVLLSMGYDYFEDASKTVKGAIFNEIKQSNPEMQKENYRLVEVEDSEYHLAILNDPNRIWVFEVNNYFGLHVASLSNAFNLYDGLNKDSLYVKSGKLIFGTVSIPDGKIAKVNGKQIKHSLYLGDYFNEGKFAPLYKNLYFFYLDAPLKVENMGFHTLTVE